MKIVQFNPGSDEELFDKFYRLPFSIYQDDPVWIPQTKGELEALLRARSRREEVELWLVLVDDEPTTRMVVTYNNKEDRATFSFFESNSREDSNNLLTTVIDHLISIGMSVFRGPQFSNIILGLQTGGYELPQTVLTGHNADWYIEVFRDLQFTTSVRYITYFFNRSIDFDPVLHIIKSQIPEGIDTRSFDRSRLDEEIKTFHRINQVFYDRAHYSQRSLEEDRGLVTSLLPIIDDDLVVIAETSEGEPIGMLVCLPDINQQLRGKPITGTRLITIGVLPSWQKSGVGMAMVHRLATTLLGRSEIQYLEASFIMEQNSAPISMAMRFMALPGRTFEILEKKLE